MRERVRERERERERGRLLEQEGRKQILTNADRESKFSEGELGKVEKNEEEKKAKLLKLLLKIRTDDHIGLYDYEMK